MTTSTLSTSTSSTGLSGPSTLSTGTSCDLSAAQVWLVQGREPGCWTVGYFASTGQGRRASGHPHLQGVASWKHRPSSGHRDLYCHDPHRHDTRCVKALDRARAAVDRGLGATLDRRRVTAARGRLQVHGRAHRVRKLQRQVSRR